MNQAEEALSRLLEALSSYRPDELGELANAASSDLGIALFVGREQVLGSGSTVTTVIAVALMLLGLSRLIDLAGKAVRLLDRSDG